MFVISTRNFPPEIGGMQNLMEGLSNALLNHGPVKVFAEGADEAESYDQNSNLRELKITVRFLSNEIRADGLKVIVHEKLCEKNNTGDCQIQKIESEITNQIKLAILKKASIYKWDTD